MLLQMNSGRKSIFAVAKDLGRDPSDLLDESIVKLFKVYLILTLGITLRRSGPEK